MSVCVCVCVVCTCVGLNKLMGAIFMQVFLATRHNDGSSGTRVLSRCEPWELKSHLFQEQ